MDLRAEAARLALDHLAVLACAALTGAGVPHVVLKGPSTSLWLYDPPRAYRDLDLLVPRSRVRCAERALGASGLAFRVGGRPGEEAPHSLLLATPDGQEIDLHLSLPALPPSADDALWHALAPHVESWDLDVGTIPVLDEPGRCLVLALHALNSGIGSGQPEDDLTFARAKASASSWSTARRLAAEVNAADLLDGALAMVEGRPDAASGRARLFASGAQSEALGLDRLLRARRRDLPRLLWRELVPSLGFVRHELATTYGTPPRRSAVLLAYPRRWRRLLARLPRAVATVWRARRGQATPH